MCALAYNIKFTLQITDNNIFTRLNMCNSLGHSRGNCQIRGINYDRVIRGNQGRLGAVAVACVARLYVGQNLFKRNARVFFL